MNLFSAYNTQSIAAKDSNGNLRNVKTSLRYSNLSPIECFLIYQKCAPVFAIISSRANRISGIEFHIVPAKSQIEKFISELKEKKEIFEELDYGLISIGKKIRLYSDIKKSLKDLKPDFSNFDKSLYRFYKNEKSIQTDKCNEIEDFLMQPSSDLSWTNLIKQIVQDQLVYGRSGIYKKNDGNRLSNLIPICGGTIIPIREEKIGGLVGYIQMVEGKTPQLFYKSELAFLEYMSNTTTPFGMTPIEALVNLVAENLLFNELMAQKADGSVPPEKLVVFGEKNPLIDDDEFLDSINKDEQVRIERKINRAKKDGAIATLTGSGTPVVIDLSRADTIPTQMARQDQTNKYVAMVFNASNQEINETGGDGTSGRSTSETQERNDNSKGIRPMLRGIEDIFTYDIIPNRYGYGYKFEFDESRSDEQKIELSKIKKESGLFSVNEIRVKDYGFDPISRPEFDLPQGATIEQQNNDLLKSIKAKV